MRGTRDFPPELEMERRRLVEITVDTYEEFGFSPLNTPALESAELMRAKAGEEILNEVYFFKDKGGREIALRFDLTLPLARFIAEHPELPLPFRRYAVGKVWRYDRPQAGRYREFLQADVDIVGSRSVLADAECVAAGTTALKRIGTPPFTVLLNNRKILDAWARSVGLRDVASFARAVDKWFKVGEEGVREELRRKGLDTFLDAFLELVGREPQELNVPGAEEGISEAVSLLDYLEDYGVRARFDIRLVRGLDYYTGLVFETYVDAHPEWGSIGSGGRYDDLIRILSGREVPATGFSIGVDRLFSLLLQEGIVRAERKTPAAILVAWKDVRKYAWRVARALRERGWKAMLDVSERKLSKQLEYAHKLGIPYVAIVGPREEENQHVRVRDMESGEEREFPLTQLPAP